MAMIEQTNEMVGSPLSGILTGLASGQAVFSIGWDYVFSATNSTQLVGTLIKVDPDTGAPLEVLLTNHNICPTVPYANSYNNGNAMVSTTVDGVQYMFIRFRANEPNVIFRSIWDDELKQFKDFEPFVYMSVSLSGTNYNSMARINDDVIRLQTQQPGICDFDVRSGVVYRNLTNGGTWSPSSYPFANSFAPLDDPSMIIGASGNGTNWYYSAAYQPPTAVNPTVSNAIVTGFNLIGNAYQIHPSTHHNVSYYTPNDGTITAYKNKGVYIQKRREDPGGVFIKKEGKWVKAFK